MLGCDVSYYQNSLGNGQYGAIDWETMALRGVGQVYIRSSFGRWVDRQFVRNWQESAGHLPRGVYHYFRADVDAKEQARLCHGLMLEASYGYAERYAELPFAMDLEYNASTDGEAARPGSKYLSQILSFLWELEKLDERVPVVYTRYTMVTQYLAQPATTSANYVPWCSLSRHPLWLAQYASNPMVLLPGPVVPLPWLEWVMWQCSADKNNMGSYYGVRSRSLDLNQVKDGWMWGWDPIVPPDPDPDPDPDPGPGPGPEPEGRFWEVVIGKLNVREMPSNTSRDVGDLRDGDVVEELERLGTPNELWIRHEGGWSAAVFWGDVYMEEVEDG